MEIAKKRAVLAHLPQSSFISKHKRDEKTSSLLHTTLPARYSVLYHILFSGGKGVMFLLTQK